MYTAGRLGISLRKLWVPSWALRVGNTWDRKHIGEEKLKEFIGMRKHNIISYKLKVSAQDDGDLFDIILANAGQI